MSYQDTLFGHGVDDLARREGCWPEGAVVYAAEGTNDNQLMLIGAVPTGLHRDGRPSFRKSVKQRAVVSLADYRAALKAKAASPTLAPKVTG